MVNKYVRVLEERAINDRTGGIWNINDVPTTWRSKVIAKVEADGYEVSEDGTVVKKIVEIDESIEDTN